MTADQPAEATQPRLWLGTAHPTDGDPLQVSLWGPEGDRYWGPAGNWWWATQVTDLRPAVVVPQREDEGEAIENTPEQVRAWTLGYLAGKRSTTPAVVVPQREDKGEVERLEAVLRQAILNETATWPVEFDAGPIQVVSVRDAARVAVRAVLATLRPATPVGESATAGRSPSGEVPAALPAASLPWAPPTVAAPVAVDEATVAWVLRWHQLYEFSWGTGSACACGEMVEDTESYDGIAAHQAAAVVRALAARDEDGGEA